MGEFKSPSEDLDGTISRLPSDLHFLTSLKFPGKCAACSVRLAEGFPAWWTRKGKRVYCIKCVPPPPTYNQPVPSGTSDANPEKDASQTQWESLIGYLIECVTRESTEGALTMENRDVRWRISSGDYLGLYGDPGEEVVLAADDANFNEGLGDQEVLMLGWPYLSRKHQDGKTQVVPILVLPVEAKAGKDQTSLVAAEPPYINPEIFNAGVIDTYLADEISDLIEKAMASDEFEPVKLLDIIRLALDEDNDLELLNPSIFGSLNLVENAVLFKAEESNYTRSLLIELRRLKEVTNWHETAAGLLINGITDFPTMQVGLSSSPYPLNDSQEGALGLIRSERLTVVTGPPGTGNYVELEVM